MYQILHYIFYTSWYLLKDHRIALKRIDLSLARAIQMITWHLKTELCFVHVGTWYQI